MKRVVALAIALICLIVVRGSSAQYVPVWGLWWWAWLLATVGVAWCTGYCHRIAVEIGEKKRKNIND